MGRDESTPLDLISTMKYAYTLPFQATAGLRSDPDELLSLAGSKSSLGSWQGRGVNLVYFYVRLFKVAVSLPTSFAPTTHYHSIMPILDYSSYFHPSGQIVASGWGLTVIFYECDGVM